ncbi:MAG TPA: coproporphyrinogen III oxidase [Cyanothece sp. UBA12306]|nr:coproporphyrinogen III oxidase [Cyanothece sp. UBA12306]
MNIISTQNLNKIKITSIPKSAYIHIPFCRRRCYYCDFPISVLGNKTNIYTSSSISEYVEVLCQEILLTPSQESTLETIFFGGGTPSLLPPSDFEKILNSLKQKFVILPNVEISLEIDPATFTLEQLKKYYELGVNRVSLGVQAFQNNLLEACGRLHRIQDIFEAIEYIRQIGINNFSLDLISGLPYQTLEDWVFSLETAIKISPNHLSCYDLVLEPVTAFGKQYKPGQNPLPNDEITAQMYRVAQQMLTDAGYQHYEISNYAKPGYQCFHNRVYWENLPYYGFGMGAASYTNQQRFTRPRNRKDYYQWVQQLSESKGLINCPKLTAIDILLETLMLRLRLKEGIKLSLIIDDFGKKTAQKILDILKPFFTKNWLEITRYDHQNDLTDLDNIEVISLSDPEGFLFSNIILATLFEKLEEKIEV